MMSDTTKLLEDKKLSEVPTSSVAELMLSICSGSEIGGHDLVIMLVPSSNDLRSNGIPPWLLKMLGSRIYITN